MRIQNMFHDDINRQINGVIKVDQDAKETRRRSRCFGT